jgi:hypothetical protein
MRFVRFQISIVIAALSLLSWAGSPLAPDGTLPTQLRLSWSDPPKTTMTVVWQTALPTEKSVVEYGAAGKLNQRAEGRRVSYPYETGIIHEAVLKGLEPGRRYSYRVGDPKSGFSAPSSFETAPSADKDFLFTVFGDHGVGETSKTNVDLVLSENPAFHLILGDLSYANGNQPVWDRWFDQLEPLSRRIPVMPTLGNHENEQIDGTPIGYVAYLTRLALPPPESRYCFDYGGARFISFNSHQFHDPEQMDWFTETLKSARLDKNVRWLIVFQHHPLYSSNVGRLNNQPLIDAVRSVLDTYQVDLVFAGHNHNYERSYPLRGATIAESGPGPYRKSSGVVFTISGGGGKSLYQFVKEQPAITAYRESSPHYLRVRVTKKELRLEAVRTLDRTMIDSFTIREP